MFTAELDCGASRIDGSVEFTLPADSQADRIAMTQPTSTSESPPPPSGFGWHR